MFGCAKELRQARTGIVLWALELYKLKIRDRKYKHPLWGTCKKGRIQYCVAVSCAFVENSENMFASKKRQRPTQGIEQPLKREPLLVGGERNIHGTRLCRRITCNRCGAEDHIARRPHGSQPSYCRACAQEVLQAFEVGTRVPQEKVKSVCCQCKKDFLAPVAISLLEDLKCPDCHRGFDVWRGAVSENPGDNSRSYVIERRSSHTVLRKKSI